MINSEPIFTHRYHKDFAVGAGIPVNDRSRSNSDFRCRCDRSKRRLPEQQSLEMSLRMHRTARLLVALGRSLKLSGALATPIRIAAKERKKPISARQLLEAIFSVRGPG
jgi:hypothetical protein